MTTWHPIFGDRGIRISGYRFDPVSHPAIDVNPAVGPPMEGNIYAPEAGTVRWWGQSADQPGKDRGLHLLVDLDDGHTIDVCHMAGVPWPWQGEPGQWRQDRVERGQFLGFVGYTGTVNPPGPAGAHVHLIVSRDGTRIDPEPLLFGGEPPEEEPMTEYEVGELNEAWAAAEKMEADAAAKEGLASLLREDAKAIKNAVRMAKGEAVEQ